jgi:pectinesterase
MRSKTISWPIPTTSGAVINLNHANDFVLENVTAENTASTLSAHAFTICGTGDRTVIMDCDVLSHGGDTVSLGFGEPGFYYHARCNFSGLVDFVCRVVGVT